MASAANNLPVCGSPSFNPVAFFLLCLLAGPAIGFICFTGISWLQISVHPGPSLFSVLSYGEFWLAAYWIGSFCSVPAALLFILIDKKFRRRGLADAIVAGVVPAVILCGFNLANVKLHGHNDSLWNLATAALVFTFTCAAAMAGSWLIARAAGIVR